ncbi:MAG: hypothetical protein R2785_01735 [Flavobacteriaceae bacterium]
MSAVVLFLVMGLFFLSMYLYAYGTTNYSSNREAKIRQRKLAEAQEKEQKIKAEMLERQKQREEKYRIANERSLEIQQELKRLAKMKQKAEKVEA